MIATVHDPPDAPVPQSPPFTSGLTHWAQTLPQHISPTAAKSYLSCSLRFWFERVACIRKPTTPALRLGKAVHAALQAFHLARWRGGDDSAEAVADAYERDFDRLERDEGPVNPDDEKAREKCRQDGFRVLAAYLDSPEAMQEKPRAVEVMLREDIPGPSVPLTGAVDLVEGIRRRPMACNSITSPSRWTIRSAVITSSLIGVRNVGYLDDKLDAVHTPELDEDCLRASPHRCGVN